MTFLSAAIAAFLLALQGANEPLEDADAEARARDLMREIRCLVCQNQSIEDSNAEVATDLRRFVRAEVAKGASDDAIKANLVARYGDWVLLRPPFDGRTLFLWGSPLLLVLTAALALWLRRRTAQPAGPRPLSAEEEAALAKLLTPVEAGADKDRASNTADPTQRGHDA